MSPPCVPSFSGDNGGATAPGVTAEEVALAVYLDPSEPGQAGTIVDIETASTPSPDSRVAAAIADFFDVRYQTYGRHSHIWIQYASADPAADALAIVAAASPFAVVIDAGTPASRRTYRSALGAAGVMAFSSETLVPEASLDERDHLLWNLWPSDEGWADAFASYVCTTLAGRDAVHSGNPGDRERERRFAIVSTSDREWFADLVASAMERSCGPPVRLPIIGGAIERLLRLLQPEPDDVTTVLYVGGPDPAFSNRLAAQGWFPEIVVAGDLSAETARSARAQNPAVWTNAWAVTPEIRLDDAEDSWGWVAHADHDPDADRALLASAHRIYRSFLLLYWGLQLAGPRLTSDNVDRALHSVPQRQSSSAYAPAAYATQGDHTWVKDAMEVWWDAAAQAPDGGIGCMRMSLGGRRSRPGEWPDAHPFEPGAPCLAEAY